MGDGSLAKAPRWVGSVWESNQVCWHGHPILFSAWPWTGLAFYSQPAIFVIGQDEVFLLRQLSPIGDSDHAA